VDEGYRDTTYLGLLRRRQYFDESLERLEDMFTGCGTVQKDGINEVGRIRTRVHHS
jgi:hypothetical protein